MRKQRTRPATGKPVTTAAVALGAMVAAAGWLASAGAARADVIYSYVGSPTFSGGGTTETPFVTLDITDAAVASGAFTLRGSGAPVLLLGDAAGFVSFQATGTPVLTASNFPYYNVFNASLTFNAAGDITSDTVSWRAPQAGGDISGSQAQSTGTYLSDLPTCVGGVCGAISGSWTHTAYEAPTSTVPEPASLALLGGGLLGAAVTRRRRVLPA